jgi:hypothetical protein
LGGTASRKPRAIDYAPRGSSRRVREDVVQRLFDERVGLSLVDVVETILQTAWIPMMVRNALSDARCRIHAHVMRASRTRVLITNFIHGVAKLYEQSLPSCARAITEDFESSVGKGVVEDRFARAALVSRVIVRQVKGAGACVYSE